jgi:hypothetical protein
VGRRVLVSVFGDASDSPPLAAGGGIAEVSALRNGLSIFGSTTSRNLAFGASVTAGQFLVIAGSTDSTGAPTVTDTVSTSYTVVAGTSGQNQFIAYGFAGGTGVNTATITTGGAYSLWFIGCTGFTGVHATPLDASFTEADGTSSTPSNSITTNTANALIVGVAADGGSTNDAISVSPGTIFYEYELGGSNNRGNCMFYIKAAAGSQQINWNFTSSATWAAALIAFKPA